MDKLISRAKILIETLPYIKTFHNQTIVIKYGGAAMIDEALKRDFALDIMLIKYVGMKPVIVHGGGPKITEIMKKMGKDSIFRNGQRVTDDETIEIVEMVLGGLINKQIVSLINEQGGKAIGLSGVDGCLIQTKQSTQELGFVGQIKKIEPELIHTLDEKGFIPIIAPLGVGDDFKRYNINADLVAGELAASLRAYRLLFLTDERGVLQNPKKPNSLISTLYIDEIQPLISKGIIRGGMIPKVKACECAIRGGVKKSHIIDGRIPHSILLELFTDEGIGTQIIRRES